jgi:hypothetical protein
VKGDTTDPKELAPVRLIKNKFIKIAKFYLKCPCKGGISHF